MSIPILPWKIYEKTQLTNFIASIIFILASITDWVDGHIARKKNIVTVFGSFLDPIADKFLIVSSLIMLLALNRVNAFIVIILVLREFYMTSLRLLASGEGIKVPVNTLGKWKTGLQMVGIPMLMGNMNYFGIPLIEIGTVLLLIAAVLSLYSSMDYSWGVIQKLKQQRKKQRQESLGAKS